MQIAAIQQHAHQHRHAADFMQILGQIAPARLQIADIGRPLRDRDDVMHGEFDAGLMGHGRQMQRGVGRTAGGRHDGREPSGNAVYGRQYR